MIKKLYKEKNFKHRCLKYRHYTLESYLHVSAIIGQETMRTHKKIKKRRNLNSKSGVKHGREEAWGQ